MQHGLVLWVCCCYVCKLKACTAYVADAMHVLASCVEPAAKTCMRYTCLYPKLTPCCLVRLLAALNLHPINPYFCCCYCSGHARGLVCLQHHSLVPLQLVGSRQRPCVSQEQLLLHRALMWHNTKVQAALQVQLPSWCQPFDGDLEVPSICAYDHGIVIVPVCICCLGVQADLQ
jgi:hypothetical protein